MSFIKKAANRGKNWFQASVLNDLKRLQLKVDRIDQNSTNVAGKVINGGTLYVSDSEIVSKIFTGNKIYLDPHDISVTPHLALDGIYEGHISNAWLSVVKPHDTVLDIGANFGYFGILAAHKTDKKSSKVVFFEANPNLIPYIKKSLAVNWLNEQSIIENLAVADKEAEVTLNILKDYIGSSSLHSQKHIDKYMHDKMYVETAKKVTVQAVTIDSYCTKHNIKTVDLIKMDIEGYEDKAYQGMQKIIKASPNITMFVEFTKQSYENPKKFYEQMLNDFGNVYVIDELGRLGVPDDSSYESVVDSSDDWVMPVFSKKSNLATR